MKNGDRDHDRVGRVTAISKFLFKSAENPGDCSGREQGFVYLWALFAVALAGLMMAGVGQVWQIKAQREKEKELLFVGDQFRKAIISYATGGSSGSAAGGSAASGGARGGNTLGGAAGSGGATSGGFGSGSGGGARGAAAANKGGATGRGAAGGGLSSGSGGTAGRGMAGRGSSGGAGGAIAGAQYPASLEDLLLDKRSGKPVRHLRRIYRDPMTNSDEWGLIEELPPDQGSGISTSSAKKPGIIGVYSLSQKAPIKSGNFREDNAEFADAATYQGWQFKHSQEQAGGTGSKDAQDKGKSDSDSSASSANADSPFSSQSSSQSDASSSGSPFSSQPSPGSSSGSGQNPFSQ